MVLVRIACWCAVRICVRVSDMLFCLWYSAVLLLPERVSLILRSYEYMCCVPAIGVVQGIMPSSYDHQYEQRRKAEDIKSVEQLMRDICLQQ